MEGITYDQALYALQLACQYFSKSPSDQTLQQLTLNLQQAYKVCIECGINLGFMHNNNTFREAWDLFTNHQEPVSQLRSNTVYLFEKPHFS